MNQTKEWQTIKENLERKFKALKDNAQDPKSSFPFEIAYLRYLGETEPIKKLTQEIILEKEF